MAIPLRQSTAAQVVNLGRFLDSGDGDTEETGLTIINTDIKVWKHGASSFVDKNSGGATHSANGLYLCTLDATDTNTLGALDLEIHVAGALSQVKHCIVMTAANYDATVAGTGVPDVNVISISGDTVAADNLEAAADGTGFNLGGGAIVASSVTGPVTLATNAVNADALAADAVTEIQAGLATAVSLTAVETDTQDIQARLPAALVSGRMSSDARAINGTAVIGDGSTTPWGPA